MKIRLVVLLMLAGLSLSHAQRLTVTSYRMVKGDTTKPQSKNNHYIGVQINQLINQIFNFSGNPPAISNPYLLIYSFNSKRTGWGLNAGLGYNQSTIDASDQFNKRTSTLNDFNIRLGVEKKSYLSKRWLASYGFDYLWGKQSDNTKSSSESQFNSSSTEVNSSTTYFGLGPRGSLSFFISEKILLGTEVTYYYKWVSNTQKITNVNSNTIIDVNGFPVTTVNSSSSGNSTRNTDLIFSVPVAIFLILKF